MFVINTKRPIELKKILTKKKKRKEKKKKAYSKQTLLTPPFFWCMHGFMRVAKKKKKVFINKHARNDFHFASGIKHVNVVKAIEFSQLF